MAFISLFCDKGQISFGRRKYYCVWKFTVRYLNTGSEIYSLKLDKCKNNNLPLCDGY
jgi:hypothetical protein